MYLCNCYIHLKEVKSGKTGDIRTGTGEVLLNENILACTKGLLGKCLIPAAFFDPTHC